MKIGLFEDKDLVVHKAHKVLIHKLSGIAVDFIITSNEEETLKNFAKAIRELELSVGLWLIEKI